MFAQKLVAAILDKNSRVCVGLDPRLDLLPEIIKQNAINKYGETLEAAGEAIKNFNREVIAAVAPFVPVIKPQLAFYEQYGVPGLMAFDDAVRFAHEHGLLVLADAKRGDIDSTAQAYANAFIGQSKVFSSKTSVFNVDAVTINPFLGEDSLAPLIKTTQEFGNGIFVLVKTSNPGSKDLQDLVVDGETISERLAKMLQQHIQQEKLSVGEYSNVGAVVGATFPKQAAVLRKLLPNSFFLVPGVGAQGGSVQDIRVFFQRNGLGAIVNSSRGIVFPSEANGQKNYLEVIAQKAKGLRDEINTVVGV
ncbi:MAG: orotidine-5'-phosphate decarboxylase [Candidatus Pacebacteria bacterium CG10_big_fil_rev_8_21_14_0_10_36_11]|nr:orotidine-5'-phosphate decarboxylase [Candidatus Pacearchaeota archaeon]OIP73721.1 MAG: orotidine 5'-phosphate decarboxylase [Candidatus Pacebacteria bacterium CG2_30_36_39]PIR64693.1 MAG: orotidine-5'-phosphate decarboxylase [Candidatus Pacebacteria bacterium CG10_big_fil_rev_8_21_14_0_10_36_11]PJC43088.1 MAG: orotidine-5'-phosphate decarboxylase [Candidatus Pacebacteria bacterium CG_4_9_14_0_2_um_filter_36_8]